MLSLAQIDWHAVWVPSGSVLEIIVRGSIMYLSLVALFRLLRRDIGNLSLANLLLVVLIADASQNGMAGKYQSVTEGIVLVATLAFWNYLLDWLSYRIPCIARFLQPAPVPLVRDGVILRHNLRQQLITKKELHTQMRAEGITKVAEIHRCYLEANGQISMIPVKKRGSPG